VETSHEGKVVIQPNVRVRDHENGICTLIKVAISGGRNVIKKEAEKILKYKDIAIETECT